MIQVTNIQDLKTTVKPNREMVITMNNNDMEDIEEHLLKAEDDIRNGRVRDAREVFKEWKEKYGCNK